MIYFNNDIKKINYQGYDITKVYACDGELVWNADVSYKFVANYSGGESYSAACDSSTTLTSGEIKPNEQKTSAITSSVIGECVTNLGNLVFGGFADGSYCYNLSSVTIPNSVTTIGDGAFANCSGLTSIELPSGVITIGQAAFYGCSSLTSVAIPSGVTSIGSYAFSGCTSLTSVIVNATTPPALGFGWEFENTNNCPIYVPCASVDAYKSAEKWSTYASRIEAIPYSCFKLEYTADGNTYSIDCDNTTVLGENYEVTRNISNNGTRVSAVTDATIGTCVNTIYANTFNYFTNLSSVTLTQNVTTIGDNAFNQCYKLTGITLPHSVTTIGEHAFEDCRNISAVTVPSGVTRIETETFIDCNRLKTIILPSTITSIGQFAFSIEDTSDTTEKAAKKDTLSGRTVYIYATTPPEISSADVFESAVPNVEATYPIYVPQGSVEAYRTAEHWKDINDVTRIQAMP